MKLFIYIASFIFISPMLAQSGQDKERLNQVDELVRNQFRNYAPGCQVLIAQKGHIIYEKGFGSANLELDVPMKPDMIFRIGSITKEFTAVAILQMVDKGQIALTDSIQTFINGFRHHGKTITIEHLLTHTSGIRGYEQIDVKIPNAIRLDFSSQTVIDSLDKLSLEFEPGSRYNYSNSNYFILGCIVERVSGKTFQQYLIDHIFQPSGLKSTYYDHPWQLIPNRTNGYTYSEGSYKNPGFISMSLVYSAGALLSNVGDLFKWHQALYSGSIIKKETLQKAITSYRLAEGRQSDYGYGFFVRKENGLLSIGHGGAIDGFRATAIYYPDQDVFIACLLNSDRDNEAHLFQMISNAFLGVKPVQSGQEIILSEDILDRYVGTYRNEQYKVSIKLYRINERLYGDLSNGTGSHMMFTALSETSFLLPDIKRVRTTAEFVSDSGKVSKLILTQEKPAVFVKVD